MTRLRTVARIGRQPTRERLSERDHALYWTLGTCQLGVATMNMNRKLRSLLMVMGVAAASLTDLASGMDEPPSKVPITISRETTYVTDPPLYPDGTVDYIAYLDQYFGRGVTRENNAAVVLFPLQEFDPLFSLQEFDPERKRQATARALGLTDADNTPINFVSFEEHFKANAPPEDRDPKLGPLDPESKELIEGANLPEDLKKELSRALSPQTHEAWDQARDRLYEARKRPWTADEFPLVASWLDANRPTLNLLRQAATRERLFIPCVSDGRPAYLLSSIPWCYPNNINRGDIILASAMRAAGTGNIDQALDELLICRHIGRLYYDRGFFLATAAGLKQNYHAAAAERMLLDQMSTEQIRERIEQLEQFTELPADWHNSYLVERLASLDCATSLARVLHGQFDKYLGNIGLSAEQLKRMRVDYDAILRRTNAVYDQVEAALNQDSYRKQHEALRAVDEQVELVSDRRKEWDDRGGFVAYLNSRVIPHLSNPEKASAIMTDELAKERSVISVPIFARPWQTHTLHWAHGRVTLLAFALTAFKRDQGDYPKTLAELVPDYLKQIPADPFTGKDFIYHPAATTGRLYSVGPNLKDDGGREDDGAWPKPEDPADAATPSAE